MPERSLIFPALEFQARTTNLQAQMAGEGIDALLLTMPADIFYVTGFLTRFWESPARPWFMIVPARGEPVAIIPSIGAPLMQQTWITQIHTWDAPDPRDDGVSLLADTITALVPENGKIGVPMGLETHLRMPQADYGAVAKVISPRQIVDATGSVQRVREIKSDAEIEKVRDICAIAGRAFDRIPQIAAEGRALDQLFRDFQTLCLNEGADWVSYLAGAAGQNGYGDIIAPASSDPLMLGDVLMLDTGAVRNGYFCDFDRNFAIGQASDEVRRAHHGLWLATQEVLTSIRPGQTAADVHQMLCAAMRAEGLEPGAGRLGHGLGVNLTEWPSFTAHDQTPLRAGMVLTLEPGALLGPGRMLVHEENIVLRDHGAELLSPRAPEQIPELR
ncbi:MAG: Xaa-Pro peptidase family protein [Pseudomonadota bacterium]